MAKGIIAQMEQKLPSFVRAQRKVADFIIRNPIESAFYTIDKLAHASDVSTATVVRLAQSMGYSSFSAFQKELQKNVQERSTPLEKMTLLDLEESKNSSLPDGSPFEEITTVVLENLKKTLNGLSREMVDTIADQIIRARHVYVTGQRGTKPLAVYLSYHLDRMFTKVDFLSSDNSRLPEAMQRVGADDLLIISTVYRYSAGATLVAKLAKEKGAVVVGISDSYDSPLVPYADYQLITYCKTRDFHNSGVAMLFLADILINACYNKEKDTVRQNLNNAEPYLAQLRMKA